MCRCVFHFDQIRLTRASSWALVVLAHLAICEDGAVVALEDSVNKGRCAREDIRLRAVIAEYCIEAVCRIGPAR